ncbi:hypothetical protein [Limnothrix sp. PR1529]|nr:hypothetical protein [Limnothrix sp. PR1529]
MIFLENNRERSPCLVRLGSDCWEPDFQDRLNGDRVLANARVE